MFNAVRRCERFAFFFFFKVDGDVKENTVDRENK